MRKFDQARADVLRDAFMVEMTAAEADTIIDELNVVHDDVLVNALDQAQGDAKIKDEPQYILLRVVKG